MNATLRMPPEPSRSERAIKVDVDVSHAFGALSVHEGLRFAHSRGHLDALAHCHGYAIRQCVRQPMRSDQNRPVDAWYVVWSR